MKVGVLAVQGDVREHSLVLASLGVRPVSVLRATDLTGLGGVVLPGGESTAMWRLLNGNGLAAGLHEAIAGGLPAFGTCAGMILLAKGITNWDERYLQLMDIDVERNGTGRQVDSFEAVVDSDAWGPIPAAFIRAPVVRRTGDHVHVLGRFGDQPVWVRQGHLVAASFHPELTSDTRVHGYFVNMCRKEGSWR